MMQSRCYYYSWRQVQSRGNNVLRRTLHPRASSKIQITSTLLSSAHHQCHDYIIQTNRYKSNDSIAGSFVRSKRRSRRKPPSSTSYPSNKDITETTKRLLAMNSSLSQHGYALRDFEKHLVSAREDKSLLQKLQISSADARTMLLIPPQLLNDVHKAITYYSKIDSLVEIEIPAQQTHRQNIGGDEFMIKNEGNSKLTIMETKKVPGPMVCALLLELIGIPHYYSHISLTSSSPRIQALASFTNYSPIMSVHSSQIDKIMDCCQLTITALSNACRVGKNSLIGYDFNSQNIINNNLHSEKKAAATLAEEIWRSVWNMQIMFTSGKRNDSTSAVEPNLPQLPIRIGRIGFLGEQEYNPLTEYLYALRDLEDDNESEVEELINEQGIIDEDFDFINDEAPSSSSRDDPPLSPKDQYRYDQAVMMFNAVLNTYANLGNSKSGARPEIRREMVQQCERVLLEVVAREKTKTSPATVLQHVEPDGISFNTVMKAWAGLSPKQQVDSRNEYAKSVAAATAERTESILEMMYEYHQKERTHNNTLESIQTTWRKCGGSSNTLGVSTAIPVSPDTSSYNIALTAWAKSSDPNSTAKALELLKRMVHRCNIACTAREAMVLENTEAAKGGKNARTFNAFPDSRTFVALLASLKNTSSNFNEARDLVLSIFVTMKEWDDQVQWCVKNNIGPFRDWNRVLNEFTYSALIRGLSRLPANSWEEQIECCNQIDNIIDGMSEELVTPNAIARGFGINAWAACAVQAQNDKSRLQLCAQKAATHLNELLQDATKFQLEKSIMIPAINDVITLLGKASEPKKATGVFETAKKIQMYNLQSVAAVIESLSKNSHIDISYADKAKQYLFEFEQDKMSFTPSLVLPDSKYTSLYNSVISGYLNCNKKERGLGQAEAILSHMIECHESNPRHIARPNSTSFIPVMSTMAKIGDDPRRCEQLLTKMEKLYQRRNTIRPHLAEAKLVANVEPNTVACNAVLKAYARVGDVKSALKLLGRMEKDDVKLAKARPNATTHAIMSTLLSGGEATFDSDGPSIDISPDTANVNQINLKDLNLNGRDLKPTSKSFEAMMNIYTSSGTVEGAEKATELLRQIEAMDASGAISFKQERFVHNYNNVINAWVQCENDGDADAYASKKAEKILDYLCEQHEKGVEALSPNNGSFDLCIKSWCKSKHPNAAEKAEKVLRRKEAFAERSRNDVYITAPNYNLAIAKWRDDKTNGPDRARNLYNEMVQKYGNAAEFKSRPNIVTLNSLLDVLAKSSSRDMAEECEELLKEANELFREGKSTILPDIISYRTCIDAWIRQWQKISPSKVEALVNEMIHKYSVEGRKDLCPDSDIFNLVLKACSQATVTWHEDVAKKFDTPVSIANRTYSVLKGKNQFNIKPTHATYAFMFLIYKNHLDFENSRYTQLLTMLWKQCCYDGLVSQFTLDSFRDSVLQYQFWNAIGGKDRYVAMGKTKPDEIKVDDLPKEWRRNVKPQRRQGNGAK